MPAVLRLTPQGHLILDDDPDAPPVADETAARLRDAFAGGGAHGLLQLGAAEVTTPLPAAFAYWRDFAARYVTDACGRPGDASTPLGPIPLPYRRSSTRSSPQRRR